MAPSSSRKVAHLKIIAADSSAAILSDRFEPLLIIATAAVFTRPPYREPEASLAEPVFADAANGHAVIPHEAELCRDLLARVKADVVHLDMSLGSVPLEELSPVQFTGMKLSNRAKTHLLRILPKIRKVATEISQKYDIEMIAIGKESIPVRIAELTAGSFAILYACERALKEKKPLLLGLPSKCQLTLTDGTVSLCSLMASEHDVRGFAEDVNGLLKKVNITEMLNPIARGFRMLKILPRH